MFLRKENDLGKLREKLTEIERTFQEELQYTDSVSFLIEEGEAVKEASVYTERYQKEICHSLMLLPYGVTGYSFAIQGLIETSMNLGSLTCEDGKMTLLMSMRSSVASQNICCGIKSRLLLTRIVMPVFSKVIIRDGSIEENLHCARWP